jgi:transcriptional regulator with XRE-family HTH domain
MDDKEGARLGRNVKQLREARGLTQQQIAKLAGLPRATWSHIETGAANPTLSVLLRLAHALQVSLEELVAEGHADSKRYPKGTLPLRQRGAVRVHKLLPDPLPGTEIDRLELPPGAKMVGVPHTPGTREYLACESGRVRLVASGEAFELDPGDVVAFRGDQKHSYENVGGRVCICYSVVVVARV